MKKHITIFLLLLISAGVSFGQDFKPFKVGVGVGYAAPASTGTGASSGALFYVEPGYRPSDNFLIGLRLESALIARGLKGVGNADVSGNATSNMSYTLNGQYYFNDNYVRPFVGIGLGLFSLAAVKFNTNSGTNVNANEVAAETRFGFYPRIGIDVGHLNITIDYNIVPSTSVTGGGKVQNNYLALRAGFSFGGGVGRKKNE
jgi:hypothetical protein